MKLPVPTQADFDEALKEERGIVACSGQKFGPMIALAVGFHNGHTSTVYLDDVGAFRLLRALKALVPDTSAIGVARVIDGAVQEGQMP